MLKKLNIMMISGLMIFGVNCYSYAVNFDDTEEFYEDYDGYTDDEVITDVNVETEIEDVSDVDMEEADKISSQVLDDYDASGSLFEKITMLEQEKVVTQLEKERAQLDLELDRLNAERIKLQMELDTLSGRAERQQQELESAKRQLEIQTERLQRQQNVIEEEEEFVAKPKPQRKVVEEEDITKKYKLINIFGVDNQLQATVEEISTGQNKRISVGKELDGYIVKSISLNDGIVFDKDGYTESLNIGK